jgi:hypothetical protein
VKRGDVRIIDKDTLHIHRAEDVDSLISLME